MNTIGAAADFKVEGYWYHELSAPCCGTVFPWRWYDCRLLFVMFGIYPKTGRICQHCGKPGFYNMHGECVMNKRICRDVCYYKRRPFWFAKLVRVEREYRNGENYA